MKFCPWRLKPHQKVVTSYEYDIEGHEIKCTTETDGRQDMMYCEQNGCAAFDITTNTCKFKPH